MNKMISSEAVPVGTVRLSYGDFVSSFGYYTDTSSKRNLIYTETITYTFHHSIAVQDFPVAYKSKSCLQKDKAA